MRKLSAHLVFCGDGQVLKNGVLHVAPDGTILDVIDTGGKLKESANLEFYNGAIVPGFVNCHCHLELSHMQNLIKPHTGLHGFIPQIKSVLRLSPHELQLAIKKADSQMFQNGIVAVGDISNTTDSFAAKQESQIFYHTFIELYSTDIKQIIQLLANARAMQKQFPALSTSIVPHAPYSTSRQLFEAIGALARKEQSILSFHNQETPSENEMFHSKSGQIYQTLVQRGVRFDSFSPTGKNSLHSVLPYLPPEKQILLVHNTFSGKEDIEFAENFSPNIFWTLCPNANLFIENQLPDLEIFVRDNLKITLGTDSLASNHSLSVLDEMKTLSKNFEWLSFGEMLTWATQNGAEALGKEAVFGTFHKAKRPGVNWLSHFDLQNQRLKPETQVKRLV